MDAGQRTAAMTAAPTSTESVTKAKMSPSSSSAHAAVDSVVPDHSVVAERGDTACEAGCAGTTPPPARASIHAKENAQERAQARAHLKAEEKAKAKSDEKTSAISTATIAGVVREKHWVIMEASNGVTRFVLIKQGGEFKFSKKVRCKVGNLIGTYYGQVHEIRGNKPYTVNGPLLPLSIEDFGAGGGVAADNDNRNLVDNSENQQLDSDTIVGIRSESGGAAVIAALVKNSKTFITKTEFSQAKYLKRKQQKYMLRFRLLECTVFNISRLMFEKHSQKIGNARWDSIAQLLSYADVRAQCSTLVCDELSGLVAGAVAHRMSGYGRIFHAAFGRPLYNVFEKFNFSKNVMESIVQVDLGEREQLMTLVQKFGPSGLATSFVIACKKSDPWLYFTAAMELLAIGSHFSVYHEYIEPLAALFVRLQEGGYAVRLQLVDTWMREIVVAKERTRPVMQTSGHGGYILTGIYISKEAALNHPTQVHPKRMRKRAKRRL